MELVTILQGLHPEQTKVARALELIRQGVDLEMRNNHGETALHLAVRIWCHASEAGRVSQILLELLHAGADVDARTNHWETGLHTALCCVSWSPSENRIEVVKQLISYKADVNAKDNVSCTPLHYAACLCSVEEFDMLLEAGARVNELSKDRNTALHYAVYNSADYPATRNTKAEKLILAGINMHITNNSGKTALDVARDKGNSGVVETIEKALNNIARQRHERRVIRPPQ